MEQPAQPRLHIAAGTRFGYRAGWALKRKARVLVETAGEVSAGPGLHLVVAPNGTGKTTLLRTLAGLIPALHGQPATTGRIHYVSDELRMDAELPARTLFRAWFKGESLALAGQLAEKLRLDVRCQIGKLSRGNRQKVLLVVAETLAAHSGPSVLLMDEPLTSLDIETRETVAGLWTAPSPALLRLVVLHEVESVRQADSLLTIHNGVLCHVRERVGRSWAETYAKCRMTNDE